MANSKRIQNRQGQKEQDEKTEVNLSVNADHTPRRRCKKKAEENTRKSIQSYTHTVFTCDKWLHAVSVETGRQRPTQFEATEYPPVCKHPKWFQAVSVEPDRQRPTQL